MSERQVQDPDTFITVLRAFHEASARSRGELANALADAIVRKQVDLAAVRLLLLDRREPALTQALEELVDLIEPYIEEGGVEE
jgi:hypothetical protein